MGEERQNFWCHLGELRVVLIRIALTLAIATFLSFFFSDFLLRWLIGPYQQVLSWSQGDAPSGALRTLYPAEAFLISLRISLIAGLILSLPLILYFLWSFVAPGLMPHEKKAILPSLYAGTGLFILGALFAFYFVVPVALRFFWEYGEGMGVAPAWTLVHYSGFVLMFLLAFGLAFELPLVTLLLCFFGVLSPDQLSSKRPHIIIGILILAAVMTPPDVVSQLMLAFPMWILFEASILLARFFLKKKGKRNA